MSEIELKEVNNHNVIFYDEAIEKTGDYHK